MLNLFSKNVTSEVLPKEYVIALGEVGVKEISGEKAAARILEYHATTTLKAKSDEVAWCAAFVNFCLKQSGKIGTWKANAKSFLDWGVLALTPQIGDVCVFYRGDPKGASGHVGFFAGQTDTHILVLGGNQGNQVCIMKYPKSQLIEFRRYPAEVIKGKV